MMFCIFCINFYIFLYDIKFIIKINFALFKKQSK